MAAQVSNITAIYSVWQTVRDLANMFFIFILLVIAIQTILGIGNYKTMLKNVILVALFINFSFFFTGAMIDASNFIALQFYNGFYDQKTNNGVSETIRDSVSMATIYKVGNDNQGATTVTVPLSSKQSTGGFLIIVIMGSALMVIVGSIFIASAILLLFRFVELILVLMFSPLAFATLALPAAKKYWNKWWDKLMTQLIFAPVYFMFLWVTMKVISSGILKVNPQTMSFTAVFQGNGGAIVGLVANYIIVISMLIYSLVLAKELGASGSKMATSAAKSIQGYVGRNTIGRASSRIANSQAMQKFVTASPTVGRIFQKPFDYGAKLSFGAKKGGFDQAKKDSIEQAKKQAERLGPSDSMKADVKYKMEQASKKHEKVKNAHEEAVRAASAKFDGNGEDKALSERENDINKNMAATESKIKAAEEVSKTSILKEKRDAANKEIADGKAEIERMKVEKEKITKDRMDVSERRKAAVEEGTVDTREKMGETSAMLEKARDEKDRIIGVDKDDAKARAAVGERTEEEIKTRIAEFQSKIEKLSETEARKMAEAGKLTDKEISKRADEIMKANPGLAKKRQEAFAKSIERPYTADYISSLGSNIQAKGILGKIGKATIRVVPVTTGGLINLFSNRTVRMPAGAKVRKEVIKEKTPADTITEWINKAAEAAKEKPEEGSAKEEKKSEPEEKPKS
jgi:hypothetical protein